MVTQTRNRIRCVYKMNILWLHQIKLLKNFELRDKLQFKNDLRYWTKYFTINKRKNKQKQLVRYLLFLFNSNFKMTHPHQFREKFLSCRICHVYYHVYESHHLSFLGLLSNFCSNTIQTLSLYIYRYRNIDI